MKKSLIIIFICLLGSLGAPPTTVGQSYSFNSEISDYLASPFRLAVDNNDHVYALDANKHDIIKYDLAGNFIQKIETELEAISIAINPDGIIHIGDRLSGNIYQLSENGNFSLFYDGSIKPTDMAFSSNGTLYVVDSKLNRVIGINENGNELLIFGMNDFVHPAGIVYDDENERILVSEHGGMGGDITPLVKIWIYNTQGALISSFGSHGNGNGEFYRNCGIAIGRCGNIFVPEPFQGFVNVFDENGNFLNRFSQFGSQTPDLNVPLDIITDSQDRLWVTSYNAGSLKIYDIDYALPTSAITGGDQYICSGDTAEIPVQFTGTAPWTITYVIDGFINPTVISGITNNPYMLQVSDSGTYSIVAVSDATGNGNCFSGSSTIHVSTANPSAGISSGNTVICEGNSTDLIVNLTGDYPWNFTYTINGSNPVNIDNINQSPFLLSVSDSGTYEIVAITGGGCAGAINGNPVDIEVRPLPTANITNGNDPIEICYGESTDLIIDFEGSPPWTFTYSISESNPTTISSVTNDPYVLTVSAEGVYEVTQITDAYCSSNISQGFPDIMVKMPPTASIGIGQITLCEGETASVPVSFTGEGPWTITYTVNGSNPQTISSINDNPYILEVSQTGHYELSSVTGSNNCPGSFIYGSTFVTEAPTPTALIISDNITICEGDTTNILIDFTGTAPWSFTYTINGTGETTVNDITDPSFALQGTLPGTYTIIQLADANCNVSDIGASVIISHQPAPEALITSGNTAFCSGDSTDIVIEMTGLAPWDLTYTVDGLNPLVINNITTSPYLLTVSQAGLYELYALSDAQCAGKDLSGSAEVTVHPLPAVNLGPDIYECEPNTVLLDAGVFAAYLWNDNSTGQTLLADVSGTYSVTVTDNEGCENFDEIQISIDPVPVADFSFNINNLDVSFLNGSQYADSYYWDFGDGNGSPDINPVHTYAAPGIYIVTLTASDAGCGNSIMTDTIDLMLVSDGISISEEQFTLYPNPSNGQFVLEVYNPDGSPFCFEIYSNTGQLVLSETYDGVNIKEYFDLRPLAAGIYQSRLISSKRTKTIRLNLVRDKR